MKPQISDMLVFLMEKRVSLIILSSTRKWHAQTPFTTKVGVSFVFVLSVHENRIELWLSTSQSTRNMEKCFFFSNRFPYEYWFWSIDLISIFNLKANFHQKPIHTLQDNANIKNGCDYKIQRPRLDGFCFHPFLAIHGFHLWFMLKWFHFFCTNFVSTCLRFRFGIQCQ